MPRIPLGFWAASGAGGTTGGASYELISTTILGATTSTITFSSIPSTYKHLQIRFALVGSGASADRDVLFRLNGDTASNYSVHSLTASGAGAPSSGGNGSQLYIKLLGAVFGIQTIPTAGYIDVLDYASTSKNKTIKTLIGQVQNSSSSSELSLLSGSWMNTATVTSFTLFMNTATFSIGNRVSLYGIKG